MGCKLQEVQSHDYLTYLEYKSAKLPTFHKSATNSITNCVYV